MVDIGPMLPIIEKFDAPSFLIANDTKKEGIKVEKIAIINPKTYTS